jgi:hypothetical protein
MLTAPKYPFDTQEDADIVNVETCRGNGEFEQISGNCLQLNVLW